MSFTTKEKLQRLLPVLSSSKTLDDFNIKGVLGQGGFAHVLLAVSKASAASSSSPSSHRPLGQPCHCHCHRDYQEHLAPHVHAKSSSRAVVTNSRLHHTSNGKCSKCGCAGGLPALHPRAANSNEGGKRCALKLLQIGGDINGVVAGGDTAAQAALQDVEHQPFGPLLEAQVHLALSGEPSVVPLLDVFKTICRDSKQEKSVAVVVLQLPVMKTDLAHWLALQGKAAGVKCGRSKAQLAERTVLHKFVQMVNAVRVLHEHGFIHNDLKLDNFAVDEAGMVQITDFGLVSLVEEPNCRVCGTPWTMSPASMMGQDDGVAGDWWALGVLLYQLFERGAWPFKQRWWPWERANRDAMTLAVRKAVMAGRLNFSKAVPKGAREMISGLLSFDSYARWGLPQILASHYIPDEVFLEVAADHPTLHTDMHELLDMRQAFRSQSPALPDHHQDIGTDQPSHLTAATVAATAAVAAAAVADGPRSSKCRGKKKSRSLLNPVSAVVATPSYKSRTRRSLRDEESSELNAPLTGPDGDYNSDGPLLLDHHDATLGMGDGLMDDHTEVYVHTSQAAAAAQSDARGAPREGLEVCISSCQQPSGARRGTSHQGIWVEGNNPVFHAPPSPSRLSPKLLPCSSLSGEKRSSPTFNSMARRLGCNLRPMSTGGYAQSILGLPAAVGSAAVAALTTAVEAVEGPARHALAMWPRAPQRLGDGGGGGSNGGAGCDDIGRTSRRCSRELSLLLSHLPRLSTSSHGLNLVDLEMGGLKGPFQTAFGGAGGDAVVAGGSQTVPLSPSIIFTTQASSGSFGSASSHPCPAGTSFHRGHTGAKGSGGSSHPPQQGATQSPSNPQQSLPAHQHHVNMAGHLGAGDEQAGAGDSGGSAAGQRAAAATSRQASDVDVEEAGSRQLLQSARAAGSAHGIGASARGFEHAGGAKGAWEVVKRVVTCSGCFGGRQVEECDNYWKMSDY